MKTKNPKLPFFTSDDNNTCSHISESSCVNAIDIVAIFNLNNNYYNKTQLINHIYTCKACRNEFKEYLSLLDKTESFCNLSGNIIKRHTPSKKREFISLRFQLRWLAYALLTIFVATPIVLRYVSSNDDNLTIIPSQMRGLSFPLTDVFPKPYSSVSRDLLNFKWGSIGQFIPQSICLYDSDLELIWESNYSFKKTMILPNQIKRRLLTKHQYYWAIKSKSESGTEIFSILLPFSIKD